LSFLIFFFCCNNILFCWSEKFGGNCFHFSWIPIMFLIFLFIPLKGLNFNLGLIPYVVNEKKKWIESRLWKKNEKKKRKKELKFSKNKELTMFGGIPSHWN
jgi:cadmium resistance protein CadD (predicted permease)